MIDHDMLFTPCDMCDEGTCQACRHSRGMLPVGVTVRQLDALRRDAARWRMLMNGSLVRCAGMYLQRDEAWPVMVKLQLPRRLGHPPLNPQWPCRMQLEAIVDRMIAASHP